MANTTEAEAMPNYNGYEALVAAMVRQAYTEFVRGRKAWYFLNKPNASRHVAKEREESTASNAWLELMIERGERARKELLCGFDGFMNSDGEWFVDQGERRIAEWVQNGKSPYPRKGNEGNGNNDI